MPENSEPLAVTAETFQGDGDREYAWVVIGDIKVTVYESLSMPGRVVVDIDTSDDRHLDVPDSLGVTINDLYVHGGPVAVAAEEEDVRGCSCGEADYGAPGHDGQETTDAEVDAGLLDDPSTPAMREGDADPLVEELRAADPKEFGRPAVPSVYAEYEALAAANGGGTLYNAQVKSYLTERHEVPDDLQKHLDNEIYLASGQLRLARMVADEQAARAEGWVAITEIEPTDGLMLDVRSVVMVHSPYRLKPTGQPNAPWALLSKGKRTRGVNFQRLVEQHQSYLDAKERGQLAMDGPAVYMVRIVKKGN